MNEKLESSKFNRSANGTHERVMAIPLMRSRQFRTKSQEGFSVDCFLSAAVSSGPVLMASLKFLIP